MCRRQSCTFLVGLVREGKIYLDTYGQLSEPYAGMYRLISDRLVQIKYLNSAYQGFFMIVATLERGVIA